MIPAKMLEDFAPSVKLKAQRLTREVPNALMMDGGLALFPQAWHVRSLTSERKYNVRLVCEPGLEGTSEREIHGATCTCPNGQNTPLGAPQCYHVAAVLRHLTGQE